MNNLFDVIIIGGGPAGLSCAIKTKQSGLSTLIIERENCLGGILKQCIHDGFGLIRYKQSYTGVEYAHKDVESVNNLGVEVMLSSFVLDVSKKEDKFYLVVTSPDGIKHIYSKTLVFATGCRERTAKQILIHGSRPSGVFTAGCVQNLINLEGLMPCKNTVILGSGDIGLIMARRLTLEGAKVIGVFEAKEKPTGLPRNIAQCLDDYNIPLYLSKTVTKIFGDNRVEAVEIASVDKHMNPIKGTEEKIECDSLVLSVGLIPENELLEKLNVEMSHDTKGPVVDNALMCSIPGVFAIGNCLSVNDLADYVSENGVIAAEGVVNFLNCKKEINYVNVEKDGNILSIIPQRINLNTPKETVVFYIRSKYDKTNVRLVFKDDEKEILSKSISLTHPAASIRVEFIIKNIVGKLKVEIVN